MNLVEPSHLARLLLLNEITIESVTMCSKKLKMLASCALLLIGMTGAVGAQSHHHHNRHYSPGYRFDQHNYSVRDNHGFVIGNYHSPVIHNSAQYILPHSGHGHHGSYYYMDNTYYYRPQTIDPHGHGLHQPAPVAYGGFAHSEDLSGRLDELMNELCLDLYYNYSHNNGFNETYREAYGILQTAKFLHDAEHRNDKNALRDRIAGIDQDFHHIQDDVKGWTRQHQHQIGAMGVQSKMDLIESTIHHLMNDMGVPHTEHVEGSPAGIAPNGILQQAPPPPGISPPSEPSIAPPIAPPVMNQPPPAHN